jgi:hypothetical protein
MRGPGLTERERREQIERHYRSHLREIGAIAARALTGQGERRQSALSDISRITAKAMREGV